MIPQDDPDVALGGGRADPARVAEAYNPAQPRDPGGDGGGRWTAGGGGSSSAATDVLNLAGRIRLGDGERLISSDRLAPTLDIDADLLFAVVDGPDGREVRISASARGDDGDVEWDGDDEFTARLDPRDLRRLRNDLDEAGKAARKVAKEADAVWDSGGQADDKLYDKAVAEGNIGSVHYEVWLTDDEPTSWVTHLYTPSSGPPDGTDGGVRLNAKDLRKLLARLGRVEAALTEAEAPAPSGAMIALIPAESDAVRLAVDGGEPATELHCTLAYLGKADRIDLAAQQQLLADLAAAVNGMPVIEGAAFAPAVFNPTGLEPCRVVLVGGDWLDGVHHFLMDVLRLPPVVDRHAPWVPHITLAHDGDFARLGECAERMGPVRFDRVRLAIAGQHIDIPLAAVEEDELGDVVDADLLDSDWSLVEAEGDRNNLRTYFTVNPKGLARWADKAHPWTALFKILRKHLDPERAKRVTSAWYRRVLHRSPNQRTAESHNLTGHPVALLPLGESKTAGAVALVETGQFFTA